METIELLLKRYYNQENEAGRQQKLGFGEYGNNF